MKVIVEHKNGTNKDIINSMLDNVEAALHQAKKISYKFDKGNEEDTSREIWKFLNHKMQYVLDPAGVQNIYLPLRLIDQGGADCKSFALFAAAILADLGYPAGLRFASYDGGDPSHVYAYTDNFIIDGCLPFFDYEKEYTNIQDFDIMEIRSIHGVQPVAGLKRVVFAPARVAFRAVVNLNFLGLATRLKTAISRNRDKVYQMWVKGFGGDFEGLTKSINTGANRKPLFKKSGEVSGTGSVGFAIAPALVAAAPVLVATAALLKALGLDEPKEQEEIDSIVTTQDKYDAAGALASAPDPGYTESKPAPTAAPAAAGSNKMILYAGAAALAFFLFTKK